MKEVPIGDIISCWSDYLAKTGMVEIRCISVELILHPNGWNLNQVVVRNYVILPQRDSFERVVTIVPHDVIVRLIFRQKKVLLLVQEKVINLLLIVNEKVIQVNTVPNNFN